MTTRLPLPDFESPPINQPVGLAIRSRRRQSTNNFVGCLESWAEDHEPSDRPDAGSVDDIATLWLGAKVEDRRHFIESPPTRM